MEEQRDVLRELLKHLNKMCVRVVVDHRGASGTGAGGSVFGVLQSSDRMRLELSISPL